MNKFLYGSVIILFSAAIVSCGNENRNGESETVTENAKAVKKVVAPGAVPVERANIDEHVGERSKSEGPVADADDNVYFSNPYGSKLFKWSSSEGLTVFSEKINGPNGLDIDSEGNIIACEAYNRRIVSLGVDGTVTVLADSFDGKKFNEPNDLFIDRHGGIYFSDPYFHVHYEPLEQENSNLYYITPDRSDVLKVIGDMTNPNGICSSPDGSLLYVIETGEEKTYVFDVNPDGTLSGRRLFVPWGIDGLTVDSEGNVYITGKEDFVNIYNSGGEFIEKIVVPITKGHTSNVCFGVKDKQTLFITAGNSLFSIKMQVKGFL